MIFSGGLHSLFPFEFILMACNVYSFPDVKAVLNHADVGQCNLHRSGLGKITVSAAGNVAYSFLAATVSEQ